MATGDMLVTLDELKLVNDRVKPVSEGGTGLTANPSMLVNLGSTSAANVFAASPRPGVTGTLGFDNGGTGGFFKVVNFSTSDLSSGKTIMDMGLIDANVTASYFIVLSLMSGVAQDVASVYVVRTVKGTTTPTFYRQSVIHEASYSTGIKLKTDGTVTNGSGGTISSGNYRGIAIRFGT